MDRSVLRPTWPLILRTHTTNHVALAEWFLALVLVRLLMPVASAHLRPAGGGIVAHTSFGTWLCVDFGGTPANLLLNESLQETVITMSGSDFRDPSSCGVVRRFPPTNVGAAHRACRQF